MRKFETCLKVRRKCVTCEKCKNVKINVTQKLSISNSIARCEICERN